MIFSIQKKIQFNAWNAGIVLMVTLSCVWGSNLSNNNEKMNHLLLDDHFIKIPSPKKNSDEIKATENYFTQHKKILKNNEKNNIDSIFKTINDQNHNNDIIVNNNLSPIYEDATLVSNRNRTTSNLFNPQIHYTKTLDILTDDGNSIQTQRIENSPHCYSQEIIDVKPLTPPQKIAPFFIKNTNEKSPPTQSNEEENALTEKYRLYFFQKHVNTTYTNAINEYQFTEPSIAPQKKPMNNPPNSPKKQNSPKKTVLLSSYKPTIIIGKKH
jgi:hypothetical protein